MFIDSDLEEFLKTSNTLETKSLIISEWNMNDLDNLFRYGNYRYRPTAAASTQFVNLLSSFDVDDNGDFYTEADVSKNLSIEAETDSGNIIRFTSIDEDRKLYFNLRQCFEKFRPRSGINKVIWNKQKYVDNVRSGRRPRYYLASRYDTFKYWNSYRKEDGIEYGISREIDETDQRGYDIEDAAPFVVYENSVPANRIVVKMQTNLSEDESSSLIRTRDGQKIQDPLKDRDKSSIPKRWGIQYLDENNNWITAAEFDETSTRSDDTPIVPWDGYVELYYGIVPPEEYRDSFNLVEYITTTNVLPIENNVIGESYLLGATTASAGVLYVWNGSDWDISDAEYGFSLYETDDTKNVGILKSFINPRSFTVNSIKTYRDIVYIKGIRVFAKTMYGPNSTFDLIEMSPRLKADITNYVTSFDITKEISNDETGLPVGGLLASNGTISLMNHDGSFSENNEISNDVGSIIANYLKPNIRFDFYEIVRKVPLSSSATILYDKYIPVKTFYAEEFPVSYGGKDLQIPLRDFFFRLETMKAPAMFLPNISLTAAVSMLLDNIGFSNYVFSQVENTYDPKIPYFFVEPDVSVAEVLQRLATATQTAMFFDEYNNFVIMFKERLMPSSASTSFIIDGNTKTSGGTVTRLPNIVEITANESKILNDGNITYTSRYIQRASGKLKDELFLSEDKSFKYKPVLLWEVAGDQAFRDMNDIQSSTAFALSAVPLNSDLSQQIPRVQNNEIIDNIIDVGENAYWLGRPKGLLYANGEIIKYDGIEYAISSSVATNISNVFINSLEEYQDYVAKLPFAGKIYPTGRIRIYAEPYYEEVTINSASTQVVLKNGAVEVHGRGQFNTSITSHPSGLSEYWTDNTYVKSFSMASERIFNTTPTRDLSYTDITFQSLGNQVGSSSALNTAAESTKRTGAIKNFLRRTNFIDSEELISPQTKKAVPGAIQSSALVFSGPNPIPSGENKRDVLTYIYKNLSDVSASTVYTHVGTRMRIVGIPKTNSLQSAKNSTTYFNVQTNNNSEQVNIDGGSGGIGICINSEKNYGYFFEICSLTQDNLEKFTKYNQETGRTDSEVHNIIFYKVVPGSLNGSTIGVPVKLYGGLANILVDEGKFVGVDRAVGEENPTSFDLSVEYVDNGSSKTFYLYLNNTNIAIVEDKGDKGAPVLPATNKTCVFVRGSSQCMFEYIYALDKAYAKQSRFPLLNEISKTFGVEEIDSESLRKYAVSGLIRSTYLSGIGTQTSPKFNLYFEEFGTIMREAYYFNIRYDQAYPALLSYLAPTINKERAYTVSGFYGGSYGAEFLIFNSTDRAIILDDTSGNFLRILGVTFTQNTTRTLSVDNFLNETTDFSDPVSVKLSEIQSPFVSQKIYEDAKISRSKYGKREFVIESPYIQTSDTAENIMSWLIEKTLRQRKIFALSTFGTSILQLGDIVRVDYEMPDGNYFVDNQKQFIVSGINHSKAIDSLTTNIKLVEV